MITASRVSVRRARCVFRAAPPDRLIATSHRHLKGSVVLRWLGLGIGLGVGIGIGVGEGEGVGVGLGLERARVRVRGRARARARVGEGWR